MLRGNEMLQQTLVMLQGFICYCTSRDFSLLLSITSVIPSSFSLSPFPVSVHLCSHPFFLHFLLFLPFPPSLLFSFPHLCSLPSPVMFSISFMWLVPNTGAILCPKPKSSVKLWALFPSQAPHILSSLNLHLCVHVSVNLVGMNFAWQVFSQPVPMDRVSVWVQHTIIAIYDGNVEGGVNGRDVLLHFWHLSLCALFTGYRVPRGGAVSIGAADCDGFQIVSNSLAFAS